MEKDKFVWLFGENLGKTANNNSFYLWKQIVEKDDEIEKYFVLIKNKKNLQLYKKLSSKAKKYIVWKDTIKHHILLPPKQFFFLHMLNMIFYVLYY